MRKEINRYRCVGDSGRQYTVVEFQNFRRHRTLNNPPQDIPTTKECFLSDGRDVNWIDENTFQVVVTDEFVRKIS
jgi:hypothetical protein